MFVAKFYATARYNKMFKTIRPWGVSAAHMTLLLFENIFPHALMNSFYRITTIICG